MPPPQITRSILRNALEEAQERASNIAVPGTYLQCYKTFAAARKAYGRDIIAERLELYSGFPPELDARCPRPGHGAHSYELDRQCVGAAKNWMRLGSWMAKVSSPSCSPYISFSSLANPVLHASFRQHSSRETCSRRLPNPRNPSTTTDRRY